MFRLFEHNNKNESTLSFSGLFKKVSIGTAVAAANLISQVYSAENSAPDQPDFEVMLNHTFTFPQNESYYSISKLSCWGWVPAEYWSNFTSALLTCSNTLINNMSFDPAYSYFIHRQNWENPNLFCYYKTSDPMDPCTEYVFHNYIEYPSTLTPWQPLTPIDPAPDHPLTDIRPLFYTLGAGAAMAGCIGYYLFKKCSQKPIDERDFFDPVFYNIMENPMKLDCGHRLDHATLEQLIPNEEAQCTCPLCRAVINNPQPDNEFKELISDYKNKQDVLENKQEIPGKFSFFNKFSCWKSSTVNEDKPLLDEKRSLTLN